jgi:hypothetical protein
MEQPLENTAQPRISEVLNQYGTAGIENELVGLDEWYDWLHG